jgi:hypothetical protein
MVNIVKRKNVLYCEIHAKNINTLSGENAESVKVAAGSI